ncbi:MAG: CRISPR-associated endonuclease Cas2 [Thermodesulfobacteriota bacterium]|nr:CRISPR-associated endonuclease Cas2 [Thermodesulfobacteriota bacterium]
MVQVVVAYDISNDKRRNKVAKCLQGYGERVNFSVFECILKAGSFARMKKELKELVKHKEDNIRIYLLCKDCIKKTEVIGGGTQGFNNSPLLYI